MQKILDNEKNSFQIYVDADACPVKSEIYKVAKRYGLKVMLVAGSAMRIPENKSISLQIVGLGADLADDWIVEHVSADDIVITGDIPLASRCVKKEAYVLGHSGRPFSEDNIGPLLAMRDLFSHLRETGESTGGPPPFTQRDRSRFLQELDKTICTILRNRKPPLKNHLVL
ncbi:MAG: YaiI/YqxD family protein [Candidatus Riflebacteria bacterium]|nr:YaiI/YqxD family protein [Candidatus Riflebacteria bacterium]